MRTLKSHPVIVKRSLVCAVVGLMVGNAYALTPEQQEIRQLRAELNALKALVEQKIAHEQSTSPKVQVAAGTAQEKTPVVSVKSANGTEVDVYGFVRADANYKLHGTDTTFNSIESAPIKGSSEADIKRFNTSMATTRLGFNFITPVAGHKVGGRLEGDFFGGGENASSLRVRHAYLTYDNWLVGQTWSTFNDLNTIPDIIDFYLMAGHGADRTAMVRYENGFTENTKYAIAVERNKTFDRAPNLVGKLSHTFAGNKAYVSARTFVTQAQDPSTSSDKEISWGAALAGTYKVTDDLRLMADYNHIKGNKQYVEQSNTAYVTDAQGKLLLNEFDSLSLSASYQITPKVNTSLGLGYMKAKDNDYATRMKATNANVANKEIKQGFVNVIYKPVKPVSLGVEYLNGQRETFEGNKGKDERIGIMAQYDF